jgi:hypothetical protein
VKRARLSRVKPKSIGKSTINSSSNANDIQILRIFKPVDSFQGEKETSLYGNPTYPKFVAVLNIKEKNQ